MNKHKKYEFITFMIITNGSKNPLTFYLSKKLFKAVVFISALVVFIFLSFSTFSFIQNRILKGQKTDLLDEKYKLEVEKNLLISITDQVEQMQTEMFELQKLEDQLREKMISDSTYDTSGISESTYTLSNLNGMGGVEVNSPIYYLLIKSNTDIYVIKNTLRSLEYLNEQLPKRLLQTQTLIEEFDQYEERKARIPSIFPAIGSISSRFGYRKDPFTQERRFHEGLDIANVLNTSVYSTAKGIVIFAGEMSGFGKTLKIEHNCSLTTLYAHLNSFIISKGDNVYKGQLIGYMGSTGRSTDVHLHYGVYNNNNPVNPENFLPSQRRNLDVQW